MAVTDRADIRVPADSIAVRRPPEARIAVVGNPNTGKSTLFNRLTGLRQRIGNYPGVTVERHIGIMRDAGRRLELIDLPGTYGLSAHSFEERIAINVILGRQDGEAKPDGLLAVVDATNLYQGLYLLQQLLDVGIPVAVALTMSDAAEASGVSIDIARLSAALGGVPVYPVVATTGRGLDTLRRGLFELAAGAAPPPANGWPELAAAGAALADGSSLDASSVLFQRLLVDGPGESTVDLVASLGDDGETRIRRAQDALFGMQPPLAAEARRRYAWVRSVMDDVQTSTPVLQSWRTRLGAFVNRPLPGTIGLFLVMAVVFQAVFAWALPVMDFIDAAAAGAAAGIKVQLGETVLASLIADGIIAGVGSVVVFLPQILVLFLFIIVLEDSGYLARAAYLLDRLMRSVGLSGQSIIPMISSFACAVPGIMATRVIPNRRDRIATILAAPFMTCSARLPVYSLLIAAFVPQRDVGFLNLQGLVLFGLYLFGIVMGILTAFLLKRTSLRGPKPPFALMLPEFRRPNLQTVLLQLLGRVRVFLYRAGTVIFAVAVIVWVLAYFPRSDTIGPELQAEATAARQTMSGEALDAALADIDNRADARQLERSWLGRAGKFVEPAFRPLGWDWRVSAAVIAGFPAREVVLAVLGTVYAVGDEADEGTLTGRLQSASWPDGSPVFTLPMVIGLLIFYACCLQCAATLAVIRRETNSWRWPLFGWSYMTTIGYVGALLANQLL